MVVREQRGRPYSCDRRLLIYQRRRRLCRQRTRCRPGCALSLTLLRVCVSHAGMQRQLRAAQSFNAAAAPVACSWRARHRTRAYRSLTCGMASSRRASTTPAECCLPAALLPVCATPNWNGAPELQRFSLSASRLGGAGDAGLEDAESEDAEDVSKLRFLLR